MLVHDYWPTGDMRPAGARARSGGAAEGGAGAARGREGVAGRPPRAAARGKNRTPLPGRGGREDERRLDNCLLAGLNSLPILAFGTMVKGSDKGKRLRAERARADAEALAAAEKEKAAKAQKVPGEKRQKEDSSNDGKPSKKVKQVADKAKVGYRVNPEALREKQVSKKTQGIAPGVKDGTYGTEGYAGMDIDQDSKGNGGDYDPNSGEEQEAQKQQSGSRQNTAENKLVPYQTQTPLKATHQR